jgi:hypothetical protein
MSIFDFLFGRGERCESCNRKMLPAHGFQKGSSYSYVGQGDKMLAMMQSAPKRPYQCYSCEKIVCGTCAGLAGQKQGSASMLCPFCNEKVRAL